MKLFFNFLRSSFFQESSRWIFWTPVFMTLGIYTGMKQGWIFSCGVGAFGFIGLIFLRQRWERRLLLIPVIGFLAGYGSFYGHQCLNQTQTLLEKRFVKKFSGVLLDKVEASYGQQLLIQLDKELEHRRKPLRVNKVKLTHRIKKGEVPELGDHIQMNAVLTPFSGPLIPGGFNFQKNNFYQGVGAAGYTVSPIQILKKSTLPWAHFWQKKRQKITQMILSVPFDFSQSKAISAALITGHKGMLAEKTREVFAASGLAHVLAISGLHMNLMGMILFVLLKLIFCRFPGVLERIHLPKVAAFITFLGLVFYLNISGQAVSAIRAFIMASFVLWGIIWGREGVSMRFVAFAAMGILLFQPHAFLLPSFQMSFFVVMALVAFYESYYGLIGSPSTHTLSKVWHGVKGLFTTSLLASIAILPFGIYHFHTISLQGIAANLIVIPLLGVLILPGLILGIIVKVLFSLDFILQSVYWMIHQMYFLALEVSQWPGAKIHVAHPSVAAFLVSVLGILWVCIWRTKWRFLGLILSVLGLFLMLLSPKMACYELKEKGYFVCQKNGKVFTNASRRNTFSIKYLVHALGFSEKDLKKTHLSKEELLKEL